MVGVTEVSDAGDGRYVLDSSYRRPADGTTVIAGSPLRLFRVSKRGRAALVALERGEPLPPGGQALLDRLLDAGAVHPRPRSTSLCPADLTVVIPARDQLPQFRPAACRTIVIDDASASPLVVDGAEMLRLDANRGPGGARNEGVALVDTPFVAFVDTDVDVAEADLVSLLGHFDDPKVALVAPRVTGATGKSRLARYEAVRAPLDLGPEPGRIAPGSRVGFVPAAAIVVRIDALRGVGGFDESLRYGEDVDLVWRLAAAGWRCRYEPAVVASHRTRSTLRGWVEQRMRYGTSAAPLSRRHPDALAPVRMSGWSAATWGAVAVGAPVAGAAIAMTTTLALVRKLRDLPPAECIRLAGLGHLYAGRLLLSTLLRAWWPVSVVAAVVSRRVRRLLAAAAVGAALADWRRERPDLDPASYVALRRLDDVAYGTGVWLGALHQRTAAPLLPSLSNWPPR